jgi:hypothetical protein
MLSLKSYNALTLPPGQLIKRNEDVPDDAASVTEGEL